MRNYSLKFCFMSMLGFFVSLICILTIVSILHNCIILIVTSTFFLKFLTVLCILLSVI